MKTLDLNEILNTHPYPGRGIVLGRSADGKKAVIVYFIMGRSENSRNRIFEATEDGIRTKAFDESKMTDPSLIIYHPVRALEDGTVIVTNGDQTDTIRDHILDGHCYRHALNTREFEPDGPNYTPRISGVLKPDYTYNLSILKSLDGDPSCCCRRCGGCGWATSSTPTRRTPSPCPPLRGSPAGWPSPPPAPRPWPRRCGPI